MWVDDWAEITRAKKGEESLSIGMLDDSKVEDGNYGGDGVSDPDIDIIHDFLDSRILRTKCLLYIISHLVSLWYSVIAGQMD